MMLYETMWVAGQPAGLLLAARHCSLLCACITQQQEAATAGGSWRTQQNIVIFHPSWIDL
jgi:hypothetical protein